ncbi:MAG: hypothetical protein KA181_10250 [Xylophilus sp.]|nr:hypothetical protein [Xylophilus sp.]
MTIVIVHFNTAQITGHCVATLLKVLDPSPLKGLFEIVVIDNRSEPDQYYALDAQLKALQHPSIPASFWRAVASTRVLAWAACWG